MAERKNIEDLYLTNNTIRTYYALDEAMFKAHREVRSLRIFESSTLWHA